MFDRAAESSTGLCALALCCCVAAGCAGTKHRPATEPASAAAPAVSAPAPQPPVVEPPVVEPPETAATPEVAAAPEVPAPRVAPAPRAVVPSTPVVAAPAPRVAAPEPAPIVTIVPKPAPKVVPRSSSTSPAAAPAAAPLDFASLGTRLRQTRAIGTLTKLSLKNQVDDLLEKFRAYHNRQGTTTLPELRRSYDMLLLKVLSLLQDSDPPLAQDIVRSRAAIWGILADPRKFTESNLMAGAAT